MSAHRKGGRVFAGSSLQFPRAGFRQLDAKASAVIHTLAYFSMFRHPLREDELAEYMQFCHAPVIDLPETLSNLIEMELIGRQQGFYFLAGQDHFVDIRMERNNRAESWEKKLARAVRLMSHLPFVEALALTGSLSKGTQDEDGDIDFLVLTRPGRSWTFNFFLLALLKIMPKSLREHMCANLILAADKTSIRRKSLFSATEIVTLRPQTNSRLWQTFYRENAWATHFYPEWIPTEEVEQKGFVAHPVKAFVDRMLSGKFGDWCEGVLARWMTGRIRRKEQAKFKGDPLHRRWLDSVEIGHPPLRQTKLEETWNTVLEDFQASHAVRLVRWQWELSNHMEEFGAIRFGRGPSRSWFRQANSAAAWRRGPLPSGD
jgi:predicted nucleotidyltransferase